MVEDGEGELVYEGKKYDLKSGDVVFIDCRKAYSHSTDKNLWSLRWCHFYGTVMSSVFEKYKERGGNYFSRAFRKVEGISPTEYQKQW